MLKVRKPSYTDFYKAVGIVGEKEKDLIIEKIWEDYENIYSGIRNKSITFHFNRDLFLEAIGEVVSEQECRLMSEHLRIEIIEHPEEMASFTRYLCIGLVKITGN